MLMTMPTTVHRHLVSRFCFRRTERHCDPENAIPRERREAYRPCHLAISSCQGRWRERGDFTFRYRTD